MSISAPYVRAFDVVRSTFGQSGGVGSDDLHAVAFRVSPHFGGFSRTTHSALCEAQPLTHFSFLFDLCRSFHPFSSVLNGISGEFGEHVLNSHNLVIGNVSAPCVFFLLSALKRYIQNRQSFSNMLLSRDYRDTRTQLK